MLIIPLRGEGARRSFPWIVACLLLLNALVYSAQYRDDAKLERAERYYQSTLLYAVEPDLYRDWLQGHRPPKPLRGTLETILSMDAPDAIRRPWLAAMLRYDGDFLDALEHGRLIDRGTPQGQAWQEARREYQALLRGSLVWSGALVPREHRPHTFLTSMFLHGGAAHLIGNLVFLWLAGMLLEPLLGSGRFLGVYLLSGLVSGVASWLASPGSAVPELGASGAISGVMGALAAVYGTRRVPCLVSIGLHAWRVALPGYWLAAIWVGWELAQWVLWPSNVNRVAHLGGLGFGALAGTLLRRQDVEIEQRTENSLSDEAPRQRLRAKKLAIELAFDSATRAMLTLAQQTQQPQDWELLWAYARHAPNTPEGRQAREAILAQRPQRGELRATLLGLQAEVRRSASTGTGTGTQGDRAPTASPP